VTLVDCLTLRVSNRMIAEEEVTRAAEDMRHTIGRFRETSILVSH
jgi:adenosyl cobinamide kinase/adenosyl cobinamide phosphate guanylyltransferase